MRRLNVACEQTAQEYHESSTDRKPVGNFRD